MPCGLTHLLCAHWLIVTQGTLAQLPTSRLDARRPAWCCSVHFHTGNLDYERHAGISCTCCTASASVDAQLSDSAFTRVLTFICHVRRYGVHVQSPVDAFQQWSLTHTQYAIPHHVTNEELSRRLVLARHFSHQWEAASVWSHRPSSPTHKQSHTLPADIRCLPADCQQCTDRSVSLDGAGFVPSNYLPTLVSTLRGSQLTNLRTGVKFTPTDDEPQIIIIIIIIIIPRTIFISIFSSVCLASLFQLPWSPVLLLVMWNYCPYA